MLTHYWRSSLNDDEIQLNKLSPLGSQAVLPPFQNVKVANVCRKTNEASPTSHTAMQRTLASIPSSQTVNRKPITASSTEILPGRNPVVGDFVVVNFKYGDRMLPYLGIVQKLCDNGDYTGSFLRQMANSHTTFLFPPKDDISDFGLEDVVKIVPPPTVNNRFHHIFYSDPFTSH